ncbi:hypothetical protein M0208_06160 [Sphingomonas sp. SUN019]|uniref:hypothetical protein n=1 Tax=Sphingomonas sp. SUN019 TaxID=2937788 RepID=UPI002164590E|nr:hypothetical protein [Sphingomonas sp. SUN019]UVO50121.1 hypothetical protein M0208_06160 [Sphingomonas sp. SUN019]
MADASSLVMFSSFGVSRFKAVCTRVCATCSALCRTSRVALVRHDQLSPMSSTHAWFYLNLATAALFRAKGCRTRRSDMVWLPDIDKASSQSVEIAFIPLIDVNTRIFYCLYTLSAHGSLLFSST